MIVLPVIFVIVCDVIFYSGTENAQVCYLPLEIQLPREEGWDPTNRFSPATCVCLS
jgi:hypothetical protein